MNNDLKRLIDKLSRALRKVIRESEDIGALMRSIEEGGYDATVTLEVLLGLRDQSREIQKTVYGPEKARGRKTASRRVSAFDRRFLRALRIRLPD